MEFDKSRVYTALDADKLKVGSRVVVADNIASLKENVSNDKYKVLTAILAENCLYRFEVSAPVTDYCFAYLVEEPEEKKLKWQDVQVGDVLCRKLSPDVQYLVTAKSFNANTDRHIYAAEAWIFDIVLENEFAKVGDMNDNH